jgi:tRNA (cmo5U34)-methyltransferase
MDDDDSRSQRDALFAERRALVHDFNFGPATAVVFDDMLSRSVPLYGELQRMVCEFATDFAIPGSSIYDLGCSTGTTFRSLDAFLPRDQEFHFIGVDSSAAMLEEARAKLAKHGFQRPHELRLGDLNEPLDIHNASVVILTLTLQFVRPLKRNDVVANIYRGMREGGVLILVEKVLGEHSLLNRLFVKHYYEFKRANGYSDLEIAQKREALENVLVPYHFQENLDLLRAAGFGQVDIFFKWHNFCGMLAVK